MLQLHPFDREKDSMVVVLPSGVPSWALDRKEGLYLYFVTLLVLILGCTGVRIPAQAPSGKAEFLLLGRILTQDLGQVISSV